MKIYVNKSDEPSLIAEKIIDTEADEIVLSIPRFSKFGESLSNFHLIKREAEALKKKVIIESVDDKVIELAGISGLDSVNPFFAKSRRQFSDIIVPRGAAPDKTGVSKPPAKKRETVKAEAEPSARFSSPKTSLPKFVGKVLKYGLAGLLVILLAFIIIKVLPRAKVNIITKKAGWEYKNSVAVDKNLANVLTAGEVKIPGQLFFQKKNLSLPFPATGKKQVEKQATGAIIIYNAYSSDPQPLVKRTRFVTPDGKLYRLTQGVTVPGAKIADGKIVPSSLEAEVAADKPGPEYNIGPVERFSIPGFKGSPKYEAFYGESKGSMAGGFIGEVAYPLSEDIKKAKEETAKQLEDALRVLLAAQIPEDFKIMEGAGQFAVTEQDIMTEVDQDGNFSALVEGEMSVLTFREADLREALTDKGKNAVGGDFDIKSQELKYLGQARADFNDGTMSFPIEFAAVFAPKMDIDDLKRQIKGKSELDLKALIFSLPDVESAQISLWPFWVQKVPNRERKIKISVD